MNETLELLARRRSTPPIALDGPAPSAAEVDALLRIGARVPDHGKLAPWRFILFEGEAREKAADAVAAIFVQDNPGAAAGQVAAERAKMTSAPLVIAVVSRAAPHVKIPLWEQELSAGAVCMNLLVAAEAMGFAASWLTQWFAYDARALHALGVREGEKVAGFVHIGRAAKRLSDRERPDVAKLTTRFGA